MKGCDIQKSRPNLVFKFQTLVSYELLHHINSEITSSR